MLALEPIPTPRLSWLHWCRGLGTTWSSRSAGWKAYKGRLLKQLCKWIGEKDCSRKSTSSLIFFCLGFLVNFNTTSFTGSLGFPRWSLDTHLVDCDFGVQFFKYLCKMRHHFAECIHLCTDTQLCRGSVHGRSAHTSKSHCGRNFSQLGKRERRNERYSFNLNCVIMLALLWYIICHNRTPRTRLQPPQGGGTFVIVHLSLHL